MSLVIKGPVLLVCAAFVAAYAASAFVFLQAIPQPHGPFTYVVAGAFATAVTLIGGLALSLKLPIRIARRSVQ